MKISLNKIFITSLFILISTSVFSKEINCVKGMVLIGKYKDNLIIKIDDDKKSVKIEGQSFISNSVSVYDELTKETLIALEGTKEVKNLLYDFTYVESRKLLTYSIIDKANNKNNFIILYECLK